MKRTMIIASIAGAGLHGFTLTTLAQTNVDSANKYAWGENIGWTNWRDANSGTQGVNIDVGGGFLSGYVWAENVGWITTGDGSGPYSNLSGATHGVNIQGDGFLDGFAWGENVGWVNFGTEPTLGADGARVDIPAGRLRGYAWAENVGWINLDDADAFVGFGAPMGPDLDGDGEVGSSDLAILLAGWGSPGPADLNGDGTVDSADLAILLAAWG